MKALVMSTLSVLVLASNVMASTNSASLDPALNSNAEAAKEITPPCQKMNRAGRRDFAARTENGSAPTKKSATVSQ